MRACMFLRWECIPGWGWDLKPWSDSCATFPICIKVKSSPQSGQKFRVAKYKIKWGHASFRLSRNFSLATAAMTPPNGAYFLNKYRKCNENDVFPSLIYVVQLYWPKDIKFRATEWPQYDGLSAALPHWKPPQYSPSCWVNRPASGASRRLGIFRDEALYGASRRTPLTHLPNKY